MRRVLFFVIAFFYALAASAQLQDKTLRVDYIFSGTDKTAQISVSSLSSFGTWAGRRVNMDKVPLKGNGQICMADAATGEVLYRMSFSTLFQEWQATEEATRVTKAFENVFLMPMPDSTVNITVELYDFKGSPAATLTHTVDPSDILIRPAGANPPQTVDIHRGGSPSDCIDIVILPEGYTESEMDRFLEDARAAWQSFLGHEPFGAMQDRFNVIAALIPSEDSGVSVPRNGDWKNTAFASHFDTFYSDRYLTTLQVSRLHNLIAGLPYEHIIILANTDTYGGGGIYNSYELTAAHHSAFAPVVVHEFGHSFAGLADEYHYDDQFTEYYYPDVEPWEQNITTMADFSSKWQDMLGKNGVGLFEGGGYQSKGVWRPAQNCRMNTNAYPSFCPVCQRAIAAMIDFYTVQNE